MTIRVNAIWRHPVKGVGAESLNSVEVSVGRPLPLDRAWAILTGKAETTGAWQHCRNFARGCYGPELMAVTSKSHGKKITFSHPKLCDISLDLPSEGQALVDWILPIYPDSAPAPKTLIAAPASGMADVEFPSISILGTASLHALSEKCGLTLDQARFRGNLWLDGLAAFEELSLVDRVLRIGSAELHLKQRINRCRATEANPVNGVRDAQTLEALREGWKHTSFGVNAVVVTPGEIHAGARVELL